MNAGIPRRPAKEAVRKARRLPIIAIDLPVLYEDRGQEEMGDAAPHQLAMTILGCGLRAHLEGRPTHQVFDDMNLYYHPIDRKAHVSPDIMVVTPPVRLPDGLTSYRIGVHGPAPVLAVEVLSRRSAQQQDLTTKPRLYARFGVAEYLIVDVRGGKWPRWLGLRRRRGPRSWHKVAPDPDGGVTSALGCRFALEADGQVRVIDAATGWRYPRPGEANAEKRAREAAEGRVRELEAELARLRGTPPAAP